LNLGFDVILLQALSTSTFCSLFCVFGKLVAPSQLIIDNTPSELFRTPGFWHVGPNGDGPHSSIRFTSSAFVFGHCVPSWPSPLAPPSGESFGVNSWSVEGDDDDVDVEIERSVASVGERWCVTGEADAGEVRKEKSRLLFGTRYPVSKSSRLPSWAGCVGHDVKELMSKLNGCVGDEVKFGLSVSGPSNDDANDMKTGLLARVVKGVFGASPGVPPKPKSRCIAESVAVGPWVSSSRFRRAGSKVVKELQSRELDAFGDLAVGEGNRAAGAKAPKSVGKDCMLSLGIEKVNWPCLSMTFSVWSLVRRSRRFSFSWSASSFLASS